MREIQDYLEKERDIASDPASPEWQVFTSLQNLAASCDSVDQFISQAQQLFSDLDGPEEEVKEAKQWIGIALDTIQGQ